MPLPIAGRFNCTSKILVMHGGYLHQWVGHDRNPLDGSPALNGRAAGQHVRPGASATPRPSQARGGCASADQCVENGLLQQGGSRRTRQFTLRRLRNRPAVMRGPRVGEFMREMPA